MNNTPVVWAYDAGLHCHDCAVERFGEYKLCTYTAIDYEGNKAIPGFEHDESRFEHGANCEDCGLEIYGSWCEGCEDCIHNF